MHSPTVVMCAKAAYDDSANESIEPKSSTEPQLFTVIRRADESGVSGTGRVLDGVIFHNGQVVVCWRGDINSEKSGYSSLAIFPCWEAFQRVHIDAHPSNRAEVIFGDDANLIHHSVKSLSEVSSAREDREAEKGD